jgi:parallel beta-helix repeat protein
MNERGQYAHLKVTIMRSSLSALIAVGLIAIAGFSRAVPSVPGPGSTHPATQVAATDTVHVAPPTGGNEQDRASILAALEQVGPGGTVQFAPGTYLIGEIISVTVPRVTLLGHPDGTTLRGCDPAGLVDEGYMRENCNGLELAGGHQTVRGFVFEYAFWALHLGCCQSERIEYRTPDGSVFEGPATYPTTGGHLVEGNTFRMSRTGVRVNGAWSEPAVVRNNRFINNWHSVSINGSTVHLLDNDISAPEPERVPLAGFPWDAVSIRPPLPHQGTDETLARTCAHNIVAGNRIEGVPDGIRISTWEAGTTCRDNVIRDNTIIVRRVTIPQEIIDAWGLSEPSLILNPLALLNGPTGTLENNLVEGNRIVGGEGVGIEILRASGNRIVNNTISGIHRRDPFPGNTPSGDPPEWREANGSGIWLSPGSDGNEIVGNTLEEIASSSVVLEGDGNRLELRSTSDHVRDLGADNQVIPAALSTAPDTTRFTIIINGHRQGERRMWQEAADTWHYEHDGDAYHFPRTERLVVDADGFPLLMDIDGQRIVWDRWIERYERRDGRASWTAHTQSTIGPRWSRTLGDGETEVSGPVYYAALHPVHDLGVLARLLLEREDHTLPLLPAGTARLEPLGERWVEVDDRRRRIQLYAVHGLDLKPGYVWLDESGATFADEWSVLAGWEPAFAELRAASDEALAEYHRDLARTLVPPARDRPLVILGARLFDPNTGSVTPGTTVVVDGRHISAVGPDDTLELPPGAEVVDAAGRTVLPGLWDMHAHHGFPGPYFELIAPLSLAGGITTARDVGTPIEPMLSLRQRIRAGEAVGPRTLMAGWVGGAGGRPTGTLVGNAAEARAAVDRFVELGYVQIKIYNDLAHELVPVVIKQAKQHGLRVSGEIPTGMTATQAVEHGYEEIQHIDGLLWPLAGSAVTELFAQRTPARLQAVNEALAELTLDSKVVKDQIQLLVSGGVAVDPTLTVFAAQGMEPPPWVARVAARFPPQAQRRILDRHLFDYWPLTPLWGEILGNMSALVGALHEAGVPILPGSDTEMAASDLHKELELYVQAGIPAHEVLTLATLGAARVMGMDDELGSIEPGKLADLILIDGDPTADISEIRRVVTVIKDGRVYDPAAIYRAVGVEPCCEE